MTNEEIKTMLKENTNMTDYDINRHIKDGVMVYDDFDEFRQEMIGCFIDDEDEIKSAWERMDEMNFCGKTYRVDFVL